MKKARKIPVISILLFMLFANTVALAVTEYVSNGIWKYGKSVGFGYSDYFHSSYNHHSSVVNPKKTKDNIDRDTALAGDWSNAKYVKVPPTGLEYYYGFDW